MIRSGTKRGLAVAAISALAVVGIPALANAAVPTGFTLTSANDSVTIWQTNDVTVVGTGASGAGNTISVTVTENVPAASATSTKFYVDDAQANDDAGTTATDVATNTDGTHTVRATVNEPLDQNSGAVDVYVGSSVAGTVTVAASHVAGATGSTNFKVTAGKDAGGASGIAQVGKLAASTTSISDYDSDWSGDQGGALTVTPQDVTGTPVGDVPLDYTITGPNGAVDITPAAGSTPASTVGTVGPDALTFSSHPFGQSIDLSPIPSTAGTYTVRVWADTNNNGAYNNGEPNSVTTVTITADPFATRVNAGNTSGSVKVTGLSATGSLVKAGTTSIPVSFTTLDVNGNAVGGVPIGFDYAFNGGAKTRVNLTSGADGAVSTTITVPAADTQAGSTVTFSAAVSKSANPDVGVNVVSNNTLTFATPAPTVNLAGGKGITTVQATPGSTVTIPFVESDQWGNPLTDPLNFKVTAGPNASDAVPPAGVITPGADGTGTFTYTDSSTATVVGSTDTVSVTDALTGKDLGPIDPTTHNPTPVTYSVNYVDSVAAATVALAPGATDPATGQTAATPVSAKTKNAYSVVVTNANGTPLVNQAVTFSVDKGFVAAQNNTASKDTSVTVYTDKNGLATAYAGSTAAGSQTVTATDGTASWKSAAYAWQGGSLYAWSLTPASPLTVDPGSNTLLTLTATDEFGNPVQTGFEVDVKGSGLVNGSTVYGATTGEVTGAVSFPFTAGSDAGTGTITVTPVTAPPAVKDPNATVDLGATNATIDFTVTGKPGGGGNGPKPAIKPGIKLANKGKADRITVTVPAKAKGAKVTLFRQIPGKGGYKKVGAVKKDNGSVTYTLKDQNGNKKTSYYAKVAATAKTKAGQTPKKSIK